MSQEPEQKLIQIKVRVDADLDMKTFTEEMAMTFDLIHIEDSDGTLHTAPCEVWSG